MIPLGLYIHVPFCERKCLYCDFLSFKADDYVKRMYVDLVVDELGQWDRVLSVKNYKINTVFFGGGTPTCLSPDELIKIGDAVRSMKIFNGAGLSRNDYIEYTVEANPETVLKPHISAFRHMGVNRISIGLQSAQDTELKALGRIHDWEGFLRCYWLLREAGFDNINVDLMSDIPKQTLASYTDTLKKVLGLKPEHISAYSLIVEQGTAFAEMRDAGKLSVPDEDEDRAMYSLTGQMLGGHGFNRYEISNYSLTGKECSHNLAYWSAVAYLGVGLGASSYIGKKRWQNPTNMEEYKSLVLEGSIVSNTMGTAIVQSTHEQMEEFMFLGLRKTKGILKKNFFEEFGVPLDSVYGDVLRKLLKNALLSQSGEYIYLTERGIDVSNVVLSEFLFDNEKI